MKRKKLMLIDGNSILNRAFYALSGKNMLSTSNGQYTNAVYGFINIMFKYLNEDEPEYICVAFDLKAPTFRHIEYSEYKAHRKGMPSELAQQVPIIKEVLDAMNIKRIECEGFEADDIIGTIARKAVEEGLEVIIVTGDRDSLQLVCDRIKIKIPVSKAGKTDTEIYDVEAIFNRYELKPSQMIDLKALMGDSSDNVPGVKGIGEKTAIALIKSFESIENLYENIEKVEKKSVREKLERDKDMAFLSKKLVTINTEIDGIYDLNLFERRGFDKEKLVNIFNKLEFKSFIEKFSLNKLENENNKKENYLKKDIIIVDSVDKLEVLANNITDGSTISICHFVDSLEEKKLVAISIALEDKIYFIDVLHGIGESAFLKYFSRIFCSESIEKSVYDAKTIFNYLNSKDIKVNNISFDVGIAAYVLNPTKDSYNISELAKEYLGLDIESLENIKGKGKNYKNYSDLDRDEFCFIAGTYASIISDLKEKMNRLLEDNEQSELFYKVEMPLIKVLSDMEYVGFKVDENELYMLKIELEEIIKAKTQEIYELAGEEFNINSPKQLGVILFEKLKLPVIKKTKTGCSTDIDVLERLRDKHDIIEKIIEYRQVMKLKSTYVEGLINVVNPATGRVHTSFKQTVTATGRISSTEPNLQNIPVRTEAGRKIRKVFVAENENYVLADADYSQIELRILAHLSEDENLIKAFANNEDIHKATASAVFGVPENEVTSELRSRAKAVNFGIIYGIGDFSLSRDLGISRKEAEQYINEYLDKYPGVKQYMKDTVEFAKTHGYVKTMFNRRRYIPEIFSSNYNIRSFGERIALNAPIQGTAADIIKIAMVNVHKEIKERGLRSRLILQVHDELIVEALKEEKDIVVEVLKNCMEKAVELKVPLIADVRCGDSWYDTK